MITFKRVELAKQTLSYIEKFPVALKLPKLDVRPLKALMHAEFSGSQQTPPNQHVMGYIMLLSDDSHKARPITWGTRAPRKCCKGPGAGEAKALAMGANQAMHCLKALQELFDQRMPLSIFTGSKCALDARASFKLPEGLRALPGISMVRDAAKHMEVNDINWIESRHSPADGLTKPSTAPRKSNGLLAKCLMDGHIDTPAKEMVTRSTMSYDSTPSRY